MCLAVLHRPQGRRTIVMITDTEGGGFRRKMSGRVTADA